LYDCKLSQVEYIVGIAILVLKNFSKKVNVTKSFRQFTKLYYNATAYPMPTFIRQIEALVAAFGTTREGI